MDFFQTFLYSLIGLPILFIIYKYLKHLIIKFEIEEKLTDFIAWILIKLFV